MLHRPFLEVVPMVVLQYYFKLMHTGMWFITFSQLSSEEEEGRLASKALKRNFEDPGIHALFPLGCILSRQSFGHVHIATRRAHGPHCR